MCPLIVELVPSNTIVVSVVNSRATVVPLKEKKSLHVAMGFFAFGFFLQYIPTFKKKYTR